LWDVHQILAKERTMVGGESGGMLSENRLIRSLVGSKRKNDSLPVTVWVGPNGTRMRRSSSKMPV